MKHIIENKHRLDTGSQKLIGTESLSLLCGVGENSAACIIVAVKFSEKFLDEYSASAIHPKTNLGAIL